MVVAHPVSDPPLDLAPNTAPPSQRDQVLTFVLVPLGSIRPSPLNPRKRFDEAQLAELADSLRQHGMLEPVVVRPDPERTDRGPQRYLLIAGERRWRAAALAGLERIPTRVLPDVTSDAAALELTLIENLQRQDLDPIEEAEGYAALNRVVGMKQAAIAAAVNRSQPAVANAMRLLKLPPDVLDRIRQGELTPSHGLVILKWEEFPLVMSGLAEIAAKNKLPVKALEREREIPELWALDGAGVLKVLNGVAAFEKTVCTACPFNARRRSGNYYEACMRPAHYQELADAAEAARVSALNAEMAKTRAANPIPEGDAATELPTLKDLAPASYSLIRGTPPEGCTPACACRSAAIDHEGKPQLICLDLVRISRLRDDDGKRRREANRSELKAKLQRVVDSVDALDGVDWNDPEDTRALGLLVAAAVNGMGKRKATDPALRHAAGVIDAKEVSGTYTHQIAENAKLFARLSPRDLLRLGVEWILRQEIGEKLEFPDGTLVPRTDWFLGEGERAAEAAAAS